MNLTNLAKLLEAKEERAKRQQELLSDGGVLISFTLNIPGPVKTAVLYQLVFEEGLCRLQKALEEYPQELETGQNAAGFFAYLKINGTKAITETDRQLAVNIKKRTVQLEEAEDLGRLFDMDVLYPGEEGPEKISRKELGREERSCLCCNRPAIVCIRAARHPAAEVLMRAVDRILASEQIRRRILPAVCRQQESSSKADKTHPSIYGEYGKDLDPVVMKALRSLLYEVITTPKPGLVDTENNGAHKDMDLTTFFDSAVTMTPYLEACLETGRTNRDLEPEKLLDLLTPLGIRAEEAMYRATQGVNTHKGAIFTFGVLCCAAGYLEKKTKETLLDTAGRICASLDRGNPWFQKEVKNGFPSVRKAMSWLEAFSETQPEAAQPVYAEITNLSGVMTLIFLLSVTEDSNVIHRSREERALKLRKKAEELVKNYLAGGQELYGKTEREQAFLKEVTKLDRQLIRENLSPGGTADLLAVTYFLRFCTVQSLKD